MAAFISLSLVVDTLKLGISPMPSSKKAYNAIVKLVNIETTAPIIDLGSGWGSFVIRIAKRNPEKQVVGYELSLLPWLTSVLLKKALGLHNLTLYRKNIYNVTLPEGSVVICYLYPEAMEKIKNKLTAEQSKIKLLISNNFAVPSWKTHKIIRLDDFYKSPIYLYKMSEIL